MRHLTFSTKIILGLAVIALTVAYFSLPWGELFQAPKQPQQNQIACTKEAKACPDGSSVGRVPPRCEFAACPPVAGADRFEAEFFLNSNNRPFGEDAKIWRVAAGSNERTIFIPSVAQASGKILFAYGALPQVAKLCQSRHSMEWGYSPA